MKKSRLLILTGIFTIIFCLIAFIWAIPDPIKGVLTSIYQEPKCTQRIADKFGIEPDRGKIKEYIISSVKVGMTLEEVKEVLAQFGEVSIIHSFTNENGESIMQVRVQLCKTPWSGIGLDMVYSKEGYILSFADSDPQ